MAQSIIFFQPESAEISADFCYILAKIVKSLINAKSIEIKLKILYNVCNYGEVRHVG